MKWMLLASFIPCGRILQQKLKGCQGRVDAIFCKGRTLIAVYAPANLLTLPAVDWTSSVKLQTISSLNGEVGESLSGGQDNRFGKIDPKSKWGG